MQQSTVDPALRRILAAPATVGALLDLCEENFQLLRLIAPDLRVLRGSHRSCRSGQLDLHLDVIAQAAYTTNLRLTYWYDEHPGRSPDPDASLRVYPACPEMPRTVKYASALARTAGRNPVGSSLANRTRDCTNGPSGRLSAHPAFPMARV